MQSQLAHICTECLWKDTQETNNMEEELDG